MTSLTAPSSTEDAAYVDAGGFRRPFLIAAVALTPVWLVLQVIASRNDDDREVREAWLTDLYAVAVAAVLFGAITYFVARRAMGRSTQSQSRTVVGLTVFAALISPVAWWSPAPVLVALGAVLLGRATGVTRGPGATIGARVAGVLATVIAVGLFAFVNAAVIAEQL